MNDLEDRLKERNRLQRSEPEPLPMVYPAAPCVPTITPDFMSVIQEYTQQREPSAVFGYGSQPLFAPQPSFMAPSVSPSALGEKVDTSTILRQWALSQRKAFSPSMGGGEKPAGRPVGGGNEVV